MFTRLVLWFSDSTHVSLSPECPGILNTKWVQPSLKSVYPAVFLKFKPSPYPQFEWGVLPKTDFHTLEPFSSVAADPTSDSEMSAFLGCLHGGHRGSGCLPSLVDVWRLHGATVWMFQQVGTDESPSWWGWVTAEPLGGGGRWCSTAAYHCLVFWLLFWSETSHQALSARQLWKLVQTNSREPDMQILAMHEQQRAWNRSLSTSLVGWGTKGTHCGSELLRILGLKRKKPTLFEGSQIFPWQRAKKVQPPWCSSSVLWRVNSSKQTTRPVWDKHVPEAAADPSHTLGHRRVSATLHGTCWRIDVVLILTRLMQSSNLLFKLYSPPGLPLAVQMQLRFIMNDWVQSAALLTTSVSLQYLKSPVVQ